MNPTSSNNNKIINLFDYASRNSQNIPKQQKQLSVVNSSLKSSSPYGFDTLLHFNDSFNISSIRSQHQRSFLQMSRDEKSTKINKYQSILAQAKQEAYNLKQKRVENELMWRKKYTKGQNDDEEPNLDQSLAQSQVTSYNLNSEIIIRSQKQQGLNKDLFVLQLKQQINKGKALMLIEKIKKIKIIQFLAELKVYNNIYEFLRKRQMRNCQIVFNSWRQLIQQAQSRKNIRVAILRRIKMRQQARLDEQNLQNLLNG